MSIVVMQVEVHTDKGIAVLHMAGSKEAEAVVQVCENGHFDWLLLSTLRSTFKLFLGCLLRFKMSRICFWSRTDVSTRNVQSLSEVLFID